MLAVTTYYCDGKEFGTLGEVEAYLAFMFDEVEEISDLTYACYDADGVETIVEIEKDIELL